MGLYETTLYIRSNRGFGLPDAVTVTPLLSLSKEETDYRATIRMFAENAQEALYGAREEVVSFCGVMALRDSPWELVEDLRRQVTRLDAEYAAEGACPPADVAGGVLTERGVRFHDPDGTRRRSGRVFNLNVASELTHGDITEESALCGRREHWPKRVSVAIELLHHATLQAHKDVNLALTYSALEVLADVKEKPVLSALLDQVAREALLSELQRVMEAAGVPEHAAKRILASIVDTCQRSQLDNFNNYFDKRGIPISLDELRWARRHRGKVLHDANLTGQSFDARANRFCLSVRMGARLDIGGTNLFPNL